MRYKYFIFVLLVETLFAATGNADTVRLINGDSLSGLIVGLNGQVLTLETDFAGLIEINREFIEQVETSQSLMILRDPAIPETLRPGQATSLDLDGVEYLGPPLPEEPAREVDWSGALDAQVSLRSGERDTYDATTGVTIVRKNDSRLLTELTPVSRLRLGISGAYGESDGQLNTQRANATERYQYYLHKRMYLLQLLGIEHDEGRDLDLRATTGLGLGYDIVSTLQTSLSTDGALTYDYEEWDDPSESDGVREQNEISLRFGLDVEHRFARRSVLADRLEVINGLSDLGSVRVTNTLSFSAPVSEQIFIRFEWRTEFDSDPGTDVDEWDNLFTSGIRYQF